MREREIEKGEIVPQSNDTIEIEMSCAGESLIDITQLPSPSRSGVSGTKGNIIKYIEVVRRVQYTFEYE